MNDKLVKLASTKEQINAVNEKIDEYRNILIEARNRVNFSFGRSPLIERGLNEVIAELALLKGEIILRFETFVPRSLASASSESQTTTLQELRKITKELAAQEITATKRHIAEITPLEKKKEESK